MRMHELKTWPRFFHAMADGSKTFEVRKDDRGFVVGDVLNLREWLPEPGMCTGESLLVTVTYILRGFGIDDGFVVLGIKHGTFEF